MARIPVKIKFGNEIAWHQLDAKQCPFCGNNLLLDLHQRDNGAWSVWCTACGAYGPPAQNTNDALQKWNHRPLSIS